MLERLNRLINETNETVIADRIESWLKSAGLDIIRKYSASSKSNYITVNLNPEEDEELYNNYDGEFKIRISDHSLPPSYGIHFGYANFEVGNHMDAHASDYVEALQKIFNRLKVEPPQRFNNLIKSKITKKEKEKNLQDLRKKETDLVYKDIDRMENLLIQAIKKDSKLSIEEYKKLISRSGQLKKVGMEKDLLFQKYNIKSEPKLKDIYDSYSYFKFFENLNRLIKECKLNEKLEPDIIQAYRLIFKWQQGEQTERVEKNLRNIIYRILKYMTPGIVGWVVEHGVFVHSHIFDNYVKDKGVNLDKFVDELEKEKDSLKFEKLVKLLVSTLEAEVYLIQLDEEELYKKLVLEFQDLEYREKLTKERLIWLIQNSYVLNTSYFEDVGFQFIDILDEFSNIDAQDMNDLIVNFDQLINLTHTRGEFLEDYLNIDMDKIRKEIDQLKVNI